MEMAGKILGQKTPHHTRKSYLIFIATHFNNIFAFCLVKFHFRHSVSVYSRFQAIALMIRPAGPCPADKRKG